MLNPNLDTNALHNLFSVDNRGMIEDFLQTNVAERLHNACLTSIPFSTHYVLNDKYQSKTKEELRAMGPSEAEETFKKISDAASRGVGFLYEGYLQSRAIENTNRGEQEELKFAHKMFEYLSSETVLTLVRKITGDASLNAARPQFTRYNKGHFLTRHLDVVTNENRKFAFVLGLTKAWHPDWGGLLQFYQKDGTPRDAWTPRFNVLSIFDVSHVHAVTYVTPFATQPRLSLTGWFVSK